MQLSKKSFVFFLVVFIRSLILYAQCPTVVNEVISINDFPVTRSNLSTENSENDFIVFTADNQTNAADGYANNDYIFQFTLGSEDTISIFVDMCNNDVDFDASIAIIKAQAHDEDGNDLGPGIDCSDISIDDLNDKVLKNF